MLYTTMFNDLFNRNNVRVNNRFFHIVTWYENRI